MKSSAHNKKHGFTLIEVMVASLIAVIVIGGAMASFIEGLRVWQEEQIRNELNMDLELSMEYIRMDLRLSSVGIGLMAFYPYNAANAEYEAMSIPLSEDKDGDGLLDRDDDGRLIWNKTVIYHVRKGLPDKLFRTVYDNRPSNATPEQIYLQLSNVVVSLNFADLEAAKITGSSETVTTKVIFENLVNLKFRPPGAAYDSYASAPEKPRSHNWGSIVLGPGNHELEFTVIGKNNSSSGYQVEFDRIRLSASASSREGELFYPTDTHPVGSGLFSFSVPTGGVVSASKIGASTLNDSELIWASGGVGSVIKFNVYNDLWCDTYFMAPGSSIASNCSIKFDYSFATGGDNQTAPNIPDMSVSMDKGMAWDAGSCGVEAAGPDWSSFTVVSNFVYGGTNPYDFSITKNGCWAKFYFQREDGQSLLVTNAAVVDPISGVFSNITFNGGEPFALLTKDGPIQIESDWVPMWIIDKTSNYVVRFETLAPTPDEDLDMIVGTYYDSQGMVSLFENIGTVTTPAWAAVLTNWHGLRMVCDGFAPAFGDIDGDGLFDMIVGLKRTSSVKPYFRYYRNQGSSENPNMVYVATTLEDLQSYNATPVLVDLDGDGDLDFATGYQSGNFTFQRYTAGAWAGWNIPFVGLNTVSSMGGHSSPDLVDINGDGLIDLFSGCNNGNIWFWMNTGTTNSPTFTYVTNNYANLALGSARSNPRFADINGDGDLDLYVGQNNGAIWGYQNTGTVALALWDLAGASVWNIGVGSRSVPAFVNVDRTNLGTNSPARWHNVTAGVVLSTTNGISTPSLYGLSAIEVGYPRFALFRSGIFDTMMTAPAFNNLNFTHLTLDGGDILVRARAGDQPNLSDCTALSWTAWISGNVNESLAGLDNKRYLQYEVSLECGYNNVQSAHTNRASAILRDVTIDWPGPTGLVDMQVDFIKGPANGIVQAAVDGNLFVKGIEVEMTIFQRSRLRMEESTGIMEVRPLNTGR